ncbi:Ig-like domain-containing protein [Microbacterium sp. DT81.1]|uniref:Ig-like domain-containing protein n=1 Tax=Microbacterium sp. DT81.1 TaxID=3393413 RepID=UPI003CECCE14
MPGPPKTVSRGDVVVVRGEPGSFPAPSDGIAFYSWCGISNQQFGWNQCVPTVAADGSTLTFTIPSILSDRFIRLNNLELYAHSSNGKPISTTQSVSRAVYWSAPITFDTIRRSTTTLQLSRSVTFAALGVQAVATVAPAGGSVTGGTVQFLVDGRRVGTAPVTTDGTARYWLPRLSRGTHSVIATYTGSNGTDSSTSAPATLKVLFRSLPVSPTLRPADE